MKKVKTKLEFELDKIKRKLSEAKQDSFSGELTFKIFVNAGGIARMEFFTKETL